MNESFDGSRTSREINSLVNTTLPQLVASLSPSALHVLDHLPVSREPIGVHAHAELCFVIERRIEVRTDGPSRSLSPGEVLIVPPSTYHLPVAPEPPAVTVWFTGGVDHMAGIVSQIEADGTWRGIDGLDVIDFAHASIVLSEVVKERELRRPRWFEIVRNLLGSLLLHTARALEEGDVREYSTSSHVARVASDARRFIEANFVRPLSLTDVAHHVGLSPNYLASVFKSYFGRTIKGVLTQARITRAKRLLVSSDKTVTEIAYEVGYNSPHYFSRIFHAQTGVTATDFRAYGARD